MQTASNALATGGASQVAADRPPGGIAACVAGLQQVLGAASSVPLPGAADAKVVSDATAVSQQVVNLGAELQGQGQQQQAMLSPPQPSATASCDVQRVTGTEVLDLSGFEDQEDPIPEDDEDLEDLDAADPKGKKRKS